MRSLRRQRGVAVVTALLLTTLAITIVTSLFWQQQVQIRSMENQRLHLQTRWILRGALDWARLVLRQDGNDNPQHTTLDAVWNTPLAETRLDQYIERERVEGEHFDATISGRIIDASSRYNLMNLNGNNPDQVKLYRQLLVNLQLDPALAARTAQVITDAAPLGKKLQGQGQGQGQGQATPPPAPPSGGAGKPVEIAGVDDLLAIEGYTPAVLAKLRDFVVVLPTGGTMVNVDTAPPELLGAVLETTTGVGSVLAAQRKQAFFKDVPDFNSRAQAFANGRTPLAGTYDTVSDYFLVESHVKLDRAAMHAESLIVRKRAPLANAQLVWIRTN